MYTSLTTFCFFFFHGPLTKISSIKRQSEVFEAVLTEAASGPSETLSSTSLLFGSAMTRQIQGQASVTVLVLQLPPIWIYIGEAV